MIEHNLLKSVQSKLEEKKKGEKMVRIKMPKKEKMRWVTFQDKKGFSDGSFLLLCEPKIKLNFEKPDWSIALDDPAFFNALTITGDNLPITIKSFVTWDPGTNNTGISIRPISSLQSRPDSDPLVRVSAFKSKKFYYIDQNYYLITLKHFPNATFELTNIFKDCVIVKDQGKAVGMIMIMAPDWCREHYNFIKFQKSPIKSD